MALSEQVELLTKGLYADIPNNTLTLKALPTASELDYVSSEDFHQTMIDTILPQAVEEKIDFGKLLEIDYNWVCRCLRILNYGPYHTTNAIYCRNCGKTQYGEYQVDLQTINCIPVPEGFVNDIVISKDEFLDYDEDIHIKLPTIKDIINAYKDEQFINHKTDTVNREMARICYMITSMGTASYLTPVEIKLNLENNLSAADYIILRDEVTKLTDYGLRAGGTCECPKCHAKDATFIALSDDRFFRPTRADVTKWKNERNSKDTGEGNKPAGSKTKAV